jgi:acyl transferase domain-containing protein
MAQAKNVVSDIPRERWRIERFCSDNDLAAAKSYVRRGHFIDWDYKGFDAGFFRFAPREAEYLDPQQRLLLEVTWEAMEHAGLDPTRLAGSEVGVYMGGFTVDHMLNQLGSGGRSEIGAHSAAGATLTMLSNRISYAFDFHGPSISIDTACSSSLVAFSYAVRDMLAGSCDMALAGGVNFMLRPEYPIAMSKGQFLARDGRSKSFDARGDGYGRGEGAGVVVLKPLAQALQDNDRILAVVDGTRGQSGRSHQRHHRAQSRCPGGPDAPCGQ